MSKHILIDADGVLLDWERSFLEFMDRKNFTRIVKNTYNMGEAFGIDEKTGADLVNEHNHSAWISNIPPLMGARTGIGKLLDNGYSFTCITSVSEDPTVHALRRQNLRDYFGNAFSKVICLPTSSKKDHILSKYKDTRLWWIEDNLHNANVGAELGLRTILLDYPHNRSTTHSTISRVKNWKEILQTILT